MFNRGVGGWEGVRSGPLFFALIPGWHNNADKKKKNDCSLIIVPTIMIMTMMMVMMIMMVVGINNNQQKSIRIRTVTMGIGSTTLHRTRKWTNPRAMHFLHFPWAIQKKHVAVRGVVFHTWWALLTSANTMNFIVLTLDQLSTSKKPDSTAAKTLFRPYSHQYLSSWVLTLESLEVKVVAFTAFTMAPWRHGLLPQRFQGTVGLLRGPSQVGTKEFELLTDGLRVTA